MSAQPVTTSPASPVVPLAGGWRLDHSYAQLPARFFARVSPTPVPAPRLVLLNRPLAEQLGLDPAVLAQRENAAWFAGNAQFTSASWAELSMGMTDDFEVAIEEGATLVRIGRAIFAPAGEI